VTRGLLFVAIWYAHLDEQLYRLWTYQRTTPIHWTNFRKEPDMQVVAEIIGALVLIALACLGVRHVWIWAKSPTVAAASTPKEEKDESNASRHIP